MCEDPHYCVRKLDIYRGATIGCTRAAVIDSQVVGDQTDVERARTTKYHKYAYTILTSSVFGLEEV